MRHQLYFFIPCVYLSALALAGLESAAERLKGHRGKLFYPLCWSAIALYTALNAGAALGFNGELRTNDRELCFLMEAQRAWPAGCQVVHSVRNRANSRFAFLKKYFPFMPDCSVRPAGCLLKYVSPEPDIFTDNRLSPLNQAPLTAGPAAAAWRAISFNHAYYTVFRGEVRETTTPVPLTLGFFRLEDGAGPVSPSAGGGRRDKAFLASLAGACAFESGDYSTANRKFSEAAKTDPTCLNCKYFLAASFAALCKKDAAGLELEKIEKAAPGALSPVHRAFIEDLAGPGTGKAAASFEELAGKNPGLFFSKDFSGWSTGCKTGAPTEKEL
jgi:hypothetical protein